MPGLVSKAICNQKLETMKILLEAGCSPNKNPEDVWRTAPLACAIAKLPEAVDILIDGESPNPYRPFILHRTIMLNLMFVSVILFKLTSD